MTTDGTTSTRSEAENEDYMRKHVDVGIESVEFSAAPVLGHDH